MVLLVSLALVPDIRERAAVLLMEVGVLTLRWLVVRREQREVQIRGAGPGSAIGDGIRERVQHATRK